MRVNSVARGDRSHDIVNRRLLDDYLDMIPLRYRRGGKLQPRQRWHCGVACIAVDIKLGCTSFAPKVDYSFLIAAVFKVGRVNEIEVLRVAACLFQGLPAAHSVHVLGAVQHRDRRFLFLRNHQIMDAAGVTADFYS